LIKFKFFIFSRVFSIFVGCRNSNTGIKAEKESTLKSESSENEFHCQELCRNNSACEIFYWNRFMQLCQLFSNLPNGNASIIKERDSIIGQPDCFAMNPYWPESLINTNSIEEKKGGIIL
jgi:hypothetical protein